MNSKYNLITILGPTASGKTSLAAHLAHKLGTGVISADSRQVYKGMDIGTGKDFKDYLVEGNAVPFFLIDTVDAGSKYNVYEYQKDFLNVFEPFRLQNKIPVLCGGSGLYIESVLKAYRLLAVPVNEPLRKELESKTDEQLVTILSSFTKLHNTSDINTRKRIIRAIEIAEYQKQNAIGLIDYPEIKSLNIGISFDREIQRNRITERLRERLKSGMIEEVENLLKNGLKSDDLIYYGLEYKYITLFLTGQLQYEEMFSRLNTAIHQFAKRQMTWFRKMDREGFKINWLDGFIPLKDKVDSVLEMLK